MMTLESDDDAGVPVGAKEVVFQAALAYQATHGQFKRALENVERVEEIFRRRANQKAQELLLTEAETVDMDDDDPRMEMAWRFLNDDQVGALSEEATGAFDDLRRRHATKRETAVAALQQRKADLRGPYEALMRAIRGWYETARTETGALAEEWPLVLRAWREATDRTTREAAKALGVSSSAIVRYENESRAASELNIQAMIGRMEAAPLGEDSKLRELTRQIARLFPEQSDTSILEQNEVPLTEIEDAAANGLSQLDPVQLRVAHALITNPTSLNAVLEWFGMPADPLRPVREAFVAAGFSTGEAH